MAALPSLDEGFAARVAAAAADGRVLVVATVRPPTRGGTRGRLTVGLAGVPLSSPLGSLSGTDNLVEMTTGVYAGAPLVLRGAGAGASATASAVLSDIVELAFTGAPAAATGLAAWKL